MTDRDLNAEAAQRDPFDDPLWDLLDDPDYEELCASRLTVGWDQWAEAHIRCCHGGFVGVSRGLNLTEAIEQAARGFREFDHSIRPYPSREERGVIARHWIGDGS